MKKLLCLVFCLLFCLSAGVPVCAEPTQATYAGLAFLLNDAQDQMQLGRAVWAILPDGTRVRAALPEGAQVSLADFGDVSDIAKPYKGPSAFIFKAVGETTASDSETGLPFRYLDGDEVSTLNAMVTGEATVTLGEAQHTLIEGDPIRIEAVDGSDSAYALLLD